MTKSQKRSWFSFESRSLSISRFLTNLLPKQCKVFSKNRLFVLQKRKRTTLPFDLIVALIEVVVVRRVAHFLHLLHFRSHHRWHTQITNTRPWRFQSESGWSPFRFHCAHLLPNHNLNSLSFQRFLSLRPQSMHLSLFSLNYFWNLIMNIVRFFNVIQFFCFFFTICFYKDL